MKKSAVMQAVFAVLVVGTFQLGCKGDPGEMGPQGPEGTQGPAGPTGPAQAGASSILAFAEPATVSADSAATSLQVQVVSADGATVTDRDVEATVTSGSAAAAEKLGDGSFAVALSGLTRAGTHFAQVTSGSLTSALVAITVTPGAVAAQTSFLSTSTTEIAADGESSAWLRFVPVDASGNLLGRGHTVTFEAIDGAATFGAVVDERNGAYSVEVSSAEAGPVNVRPVLDGSAVALQLQLQFVALPADVTTVAAFASPSAVQVGGAGGQLIASVAVNGQAANGRTVTVTSATGSGTVGGVTALGNGLYAAQVSNLVAESAVFTVKDDASAITTNVTVTFLPGPVRAVEVSFNPPQLDADTGTAVAEIRLSDAHNNGVPGQQVAAALAAASCAVDVTDGSSVCAELGPVTEQGAGIYVATVTAAHNAVDDVVVRGLSDFLVGTGTLDVTAGAPHADASTLQLHRPSVPADGVSPAILQVIPRDRYSNLVGSGVTVSAAPVTSTTAAASAFKVRNDGAHVSWLTNSVAESAEYSVTAGAATLAPPATVSFVAPTHTLQLAAAATATGHDLTATLMSGATPVAGAAIGFYVDADFGASFSCTTDGAGTCTVPFSATVSGSYSVLAQDGATGSSAATLITVP